MQGERVEKNIPQAIACLEQAAQMGNSFAEYRLAQIYLSEPDYFNWQKAVEYLTRSAENGNAYATYTLKRMSENTYLSLATNILDLVGHLAELESQRPIRDCTTMPRPKRKQRFEHEYCM